jgi:tripartite-type tricarboxylate transporter receptor subunit TctC
MIAASGNASRGETMHVLRRWIGCILLLSAALLRADELPEQIRVVVPYTAGSSLDARARVIADAVGQRLERRITVENRPGAGGTIGAQQVAKSKPDGSTLLFHNNSHVVSPQIYDKPGYDPIRDFVPVTLAYASGMVLVAHPGLGANSVKDLVALARREAAPLSYASSGTGGLPHLAMELFKGTAGIDLLHVPYRGDGQALADLLAGRVSLMMSGYPVVQPHVRAGTLYALAVTSSGRAEIFPGVPTVAEAGYPGYALDVWVGFFAPANTPRAVVDRLNREIAAALTTPVVQKHLAATGARAAVNTPAEFAALVRQEGERYGSLVRELGLKAE